MTTSLPSKPALSLRETCEFCGSSLEFHEIRVGSRVFRPRPKPCSCPEAQTQYAQEQHIRQVEKDRQTEGERAERIELLRKQAMFPERWEDRTFNHFKVTPQNKAAFETAMRYAERFDQANGRGILFTGTVGTGKTHLSAAIGQHLLDEGKSVLYGTVATHLARLRHTYGNDKQTERQVMDQLIRCQLLIIDDVGKEKVTEWVDQTVFEIINTRYEHRKPVVITTNLSLSEIRDKYTVTGDALVSRIIEMCAGVQMSGADWRKESAKQRKGAG